MPWTFLPFLTSRQGIASTKTKDIFFFLWSDLWSWLWYVGIKIKILLDTAFGSTGGGDQEKPPEQKPQGKGNHTEQSNLSRGIDNKTGTFKLFTHVLFSVRHIL